MADQGGTGEAGPRDAAVMEAILKETGVQQYEPNVVHQMLEFSYSKFQKILIIHGTIMTSPVFYCDVYLITGYIVGVLEEAKLYSEHCGKKEIDESDVRLAIHNKLDHSFTSPPPRDVRASSSTMTIYGNHLCFLF